VCVCPCVCARGRVKSACQRLLTLGPPISLWLANMAVRVYVRTYYSARAVPTTTAAAAAVRPKITRGRVHTCARARACVCVMAKGPARRSTRHAIRSRTRSWTSSSSRFQNNKTPTRGDARSVFSTNRADCTRIHG